MAANASKDQHPKGSRDQNASNLYMPSDSQSASKDPVSITSLIPFSSIAMVGVIALLRPEQFQEILEIGRNSLGVSTPVLIVACIVGGILALFLVQQGSNLVRYAHKRYTSYVNDKASLAKERDALILFFNSLGGRSWKDKTRWCSADPVKRWKGVKVDPQSGHVIKIILPSNNLAGSLPGAALLDLPHLIELDLRENEITGKIPSELGELRNLEGIYLYDNYLEGKIPSSLLTLPHLNGIYLFSNRLEDVEAMREEFKKKITQGYVFI